jgi:hypothetical protein
MDYISLNWGIACGYVEEVVACFRRYSGQDLKIYSVKHTFQKSVTIPLSKHIYIQADTDLLISLSLFGGNGEHHEKKNSHIYCSVVRRANMEAFKIRVLVTRKQLSVKHARKHEQ